MITFAAKLWEINKFRRYWHYSNNGCCFRWSMPPRRKPTASRPNR